MQDMNIRSSTGSDSRKHIDRSCESCHGAPVATSLVAKDSADSLIKLCSGVSESHEDVVRICGPSGVGRHFGIVISISETNPLLHWEVANDWSPAL